MIELPVPIGKKQFGETHPKGWGYEYWVDNRSEYCGKILHFDKGKKCSFHYHKLKTETFCVLSGKIRLKYSSGDDLDSASEITLERGEIFFINPGLRHQMLGLEESDIMEISTQHFEDDSYRIVKGD
jgi:quercetin dioxygenase-like cupin family protein